MKSLKLLLALIFQSIILSAFSQTETNMFRNNLNYDWGFDYYYSSPTIANGKILIGAKDGFVYNIDASNGKEIWKFKTDGIVRSTPAVENNDTYFGDVEGILYKVDFNSGK